MNVASFKDCKKLYELSGWGKNIQKDKLDIWGWNEKTGKSAVITQDKLNGFPTELVPAYNLGYLMRKLQSISPEYNVKVFYSVTNCIWKAEFAGIFKPTMAETPEDAVAKLAIRTLKEQA